MKTLTINITDNEFKIIETICEKKGISKVGLVRQSIRLYQKVNERLEDGHKLFSNDNKTKKQLLIIS